MTMLEILTIPILVLGLPLSYYLLLCLVDKVSEIMESFRK